MSETKDKDYVGFKKSVKHAKDYFLSTFYSLDPFRKDESSRFKPSDQPRFECFKPEFRPIVRILSHYDADGLSAAGILARALLRERIPYQITILKQLEESNLLKIIDSVPKQSYDFFIFSDFGTSQYPLIKEHCKFPFLILDHHTPDENHELNKEPFHVNPHFYGIDGTYEISGAGVSYLFVKELNPNNKDLSAVALVGATGDIQNKSSSGDFIGLNLEIQNDAVQGKEIEVLKDLNIDRNIYLPRALAYTLRLGVEIPGISKNPKSCEDLIKSQGIKLYTDLNEPRCLAMLSLTEKQKLNNALLKHMLIDSHLPKETVANLFTSHILIKSPTYSDKIVDTREFSSLLNACGRMGNPAVGISIILGDEKAFELSASLLAKYKRDLSKAIKYAKETKQTAKNIFIIDGKEIIQENIIGTVASILNFDEEENLGKPIISYARSDDDQIKISTRCPEPLLEKGVDLSLAIKNAGKTIGLNEISGGHKASAGAKIPADKIAEFIEAFDNEIGNQLQNT